MKETSWKCYTTPQDAWDAMLDACHSASRSIDLEQFIFINDEVGKRFLDICIQKAKEGVRVRLLCDAAGSFSFFSSSFIKDLTREGLEIIFFNSFIPGTLHNHSLWFFRDHRKLLVIDQKVGFTGGICLTSEVKNWRDTHVRIEGEVIIEMQESFNRMWERAHKRKYTEGTSEKIGIDGFNYITNIPRPRKRFLYYRLIDAIRSAHKSIYLTTPYFVPDRRFLRVLKLARRRGVIIKLLVPEYSDHPVVDLGAKTFFNSILTSGIELFQYQQKMIHSKVAIIDDEWVTIGSLNFDNVSFLYNFEANLISSKKDFIHELTAHFLNDLTHARQVTLEIWKKRSLLQKILELCVIPIRKLL